MLFCLSVVFCVFMIAAFTRVIAQPRPLRTSFFGELQKYAPAPAPYSKPWQPETLFFQGLETSRSTTFARGGIYVFMGV